jgi:hypothetical protein
MVEIVRIMPRGRAARRESEVLARLQWCHGVHGAKLCRLLKDLNEVKGMGGSID